jgi:glycosyltransferase involved in cell wall biosynthesis
VKHTRRTPLYYRIDRLCLPRYEKVLCVSGDLVDECRACGVADRRCLLIENGIDTGDFQRRRSVEQTKQDFGIPPSRLVIGAAGRLSPEKGFDLLIQAVDQLLRHELDVELLILGEGDDRPRLEKLIASLGRDDRCRLLGYATDPRPFYEALDVFALSSLREGLPNVLLEALAMEVPVVATAVAGVPRLIQDGRNGRLVPPADVGALTEALMDLLRDPHLRASFCRAGRRTVETSYSFARRTARLRAVYDELVSRPRSTDSLFATGVS